MVASSFFSVIGDKKSLTNLTNLGQLENEERRQIEINRLLTEDRNDKENLPI